jgi:hypothetical protein
MRMKKQNKLKGIEGPCGLHAIIPDVSPVGIEALEKSYQENIRNSPLFDEIVKKFGKEKAEELLKEFNVVEIKD